MDTLKILSFLQERNPFTDDKSLRNIETGVTAESSVNVDQAKEIGMMIIESMAGKNILDYTFKKSNHAITLSVKSAIKVCGESVQVDPQLLFQRLITVFNDFFEDKSEIFKYELCSFPPSIFDASGFPREAHKPKLADAIWALGECGVPAIESSVIQYVLDGGSLLHRIPWPKGISFSLICIIYTDYVVKKYKNPVVVFDGY